MRRRNSKIIFISYAWKDDQPFVERLYADLRKIGYRPWMDKTDMPSRGRSLPREVQEQLQRCDRVIAVMGPAAITSEPCKAERAFALNAGKIITCILRIGEYEMLPSDLSKDFIPDFRVSRPYDTAFQKLTNILKAPPAVRGRLFDVPSLPTHWVSRTDVLDRLRAVLTAAELTERGAMNSTGHVGLYGMAGVGKTVIATLIAQDHIVRRQFRDGVCWITLGRKPRLRSELHKVLRALGETPPPDAGISSARMKLIKALESKECLLILDDVWDVASVEPFLRAANPRCRLLITTRDLAVINSLGAHDCSVDVLTASQAEALLAKWTGLKAGTLPNSYVDIIRECGWLPLALAISGAMLRGKSRATWKRVSDLLHNADLASLKRQLPDYSYSGVLKAIQTSFEHVNDEDPVLAKRFVALAVLPKNTIIHPVVQQTLWGADETTALETAERLSELSLAQREGERGSIRLHDLHLDYARTHAVSGPGVAPHCNRGDRTLSPCNLARSGSVRITGYWAIVSI